MKIFFLFIWCYEYYQLIEEKRVVASNLSVKVKEEHMHQDLEKVLPSLVERMKNERACLGGWHFGSVSRGLQDIYSDYDLVFLISDSSFESFAKKIPKIMKQCCDLLLLIWEEHFNCHYIKNDCCLIKIGENLHQIDIFLVNDKYPYKRLCRLHATGCNETDIIFDKNHAVKKYFDLSKPILAEEYDPIRAIDTYWFHTHMLIKYLKRDDFFKLMKNIDVLFQAHVHLLLSFYDRSLWGDLESKIKLWIPKKKQEYLKAYFTNGNERHFEEMVKRNLKFFQKDAEYICEKLNLCYSSIIPKEVIDYFNRRLDGNEDHKLGWVP